MSTSPNLLSMTPSEVFLVIVFCTVAAVACALGGYAGAVNTRRACFVSLRSLGLLPLVVFIIASMLKAMLFPLDHDFPSPGFLASIGSMLFWCVWMMPIILVSAAFGWALTWLVCHLYRLCRRRSTLDTRPSTN